MIVQCPSCRVRVRIDSNRHGGRKLKIRCPSCRKTSQVVVPATGVKQTKGTDTDAPRILVAHADQALCQTICTVVESAGMECRQCHDGSSALTQLEIWRPQVAVVDVALPGIYAFEVVDRVKSCNGLENISIILLSSVYNKAAYKRRPSDLYGADDYIEQHHIPDDLVPKIRFLLDGNEKSSVRPPSSEAEKSRWDSVNQQIQKAGEQQLESGEEMERARQLARIIASDIALYHHDKLDDARSGTDIEVCFPREIDEAVRLFLERFPGRDRLARTLVVEVLGDLVNGQLNRP